MCVLIHVQQKQAVFVLDTGGGDAGLCTLRILGNPNLDGVERKKYTQCIVRTDAVKASPPQKKKGDRKGEKKKKEIT